MITHLRSLSKQTQATSTSVPTVDSVNLGACTLTRYDVPDTRTSFSLERAAAHPSSNSSGCVSGSAIAAASLLADAADDLAAVDEVDDGAAVRLDFHASKAFGTRLYGNENEASSEVS